MKNCSNIIISPLCIEIKKKLNKRTALSLGHSTAGGVAVTAGEAVLEGGDDIKVSFDFGFDGFQLERSIPQEVSKFCRRGSWMQNL